MVMKFRTTLPLIFLLMTSGDFGEDRSVTYETKSICALKGSSVNMSCTYRYPQEHTLTDTFWIKKLDVEIKSLKEYPEYKDRVEYIEDRQTKTAVLRLNNVTENDEKEYCFRLITATDKEKWIGYPGIQLHVSGLQVQAPQLVLEKETLNLTCRSTCNLTDSFIWYKNGQALNSTSDILQLQPVRSDSGRYSCAVRGHEHLPSPAVNISVEYDWRIGYIIIVCVSTPTVALFGLFLLILIVRRRKKIRNNDTKDSDNHFNDSRDIEQKKTSKGKASESGGEDVVLYASVKRPRNKAAKKPEEDEIQYASITVHRPAAEAKSSADKEQDLSVIYSGIK